MSNEFVISGRPPLKTYEVTQGLGVNGYDYVEVAYPDSITEVYTFKQKGGSGNTLATVTVVYTDSTKASLLSVTKT